jgi:homoserine kinase type II
VNGQEKSGKTRKPVQMAVYTEVSFEDLENILSRYDIGAPLSFKGIAEGVENSNYVLQAEKGAFILTLYEKRVNAADLPFFLGLLQHLATRGICCPTPVSDKNGTQLTTINGRPAAFFTFLNGLSLRRPEVSHCASAGAALAAFHAAGQGFALARPNALGPAGWAPLAAPCLTRADAVQDGLKELIETALREIVPAWPKDLPAGVIHADLFPDNVLFMNGEVSGLIDFYFACNDFLVYDLAVMLNAWCFEADGAFNITKGQAMIGAYQKRRPLSDAEAAALPLLARGSALRFLLTRLYDWLHQDPNALVRPKDPRDYSKRLRFHNLIKHPEEYGL